jgi:hypothetical protein
VVELGRPLLFFLALAIATATFAIFSSLRLGWGLAAFVSGLLAGYISRRAIDGLAASLLSAALSYALPLAYRSSVSPQLPAILASASGLDAMLLLLLAASMALLVSLLSSLLGIALSRLLRVRK